MPDAVQVASVTADFAIDLRICYRVELTCGCRYWEYRRIGNAPPRRQTPATCFASHGQPRPTEDGRDYH